MTTTDPRDLAAELPESEQEALRAELEQLRTQNASLRGQVEQNARILEAAEEGIWLIDTSNINTYVNPRLCQILGYAAEEMLGRSLFDFMDENGRSTSERNVERRRAGIREQHDFTFLKKDGSEVHTRLSTSPVYDADGGYAGALALVIDVSEQRQAELERDELQHQVLQAQRLESLGLLAGGIAHDFNNLLAVILGHAELAMMSLSVGSPAAPQLERVLKSTEMAADLTRKMLAYAGRAPIDIVPMRLSALVAEVAGLLRASIPKKIALELDVEHELPPVDGDKAQLHQLLMNLVINAADAMGEECGTVSIRTETTELDADQAALLVPAGNAKPGRCVVLEVADDGCGMAPETLERIYDPYFTTKPHGHGLGLAATLGIVRGHGGGVGVRSRPGEGTRFRIYLPVSAPTATPAKIALREALHGSECVLVVDDEDHVRDMFRASLEAFGYRVVTCEGGQSALSCLLEAPEAYDLLLVDLSMPDLGGDEVVDTVRGRGVDLPIIVCSGYAELDVMSRFGSSAGIRFLQKPASPAELARTVRRVLDQRLSRRL